MKYSRYLPLFLWLCITPGFFAAQPGASPSQEADSVYQAGLAFQKKRHYPEAIRHIQKALDLKREWLPAEAPELADMLHALGQCQYSSGDLIEAIRHFQESLSIRLTNYGEVHPEVGKSLNNLGLCHLGKQDFPTAREYLERSIDVKKKTGDQNKVSLSTSYFNLGNCYYFQGDIEKALQYHFLCYEIRAEDLPPNHPLTASVLLGLGSDYYRLYQIDQALEYYSRALDMLEKGNPVNTIELAGALDNIGNCHSRKKDFSKAIEYHLRSEALLQQMAPPPYSDLARVYQNLGMVSRELQQYEEAIGQFNKALDIRIGQLGPDHPFTANTHYSIAQCYHFAGNFEKALESFEKAFEASSYRPNVFNNPELTVMGHSDYGKTLTEAYQSKRDPALLKQAMDHFYDGFEELQAFRDNQSYLSSKTRITGRVMPLFEHAILTLLLQEKEGIEPEAKAKAFDIAEKSKAWALFEAMKESEALQAAVIPKALQQEDYELRTNIAYLERKRQEQLDAGMDPLSEKMLGIQSQLLEMHEKVQALKKRFEEEHPGYFKARYNLKTIGLQEVQAGLAPDQTLLEYLVGNELLLLFVVKPSEMQVLALPLDFPLYSLVEQLQQSILGYHDYANKPDTALAASALRYAEAAQALYQKLLAPVESHLSESLIIVPDGVLGLIPFEALLSAAPQKANNFGTYPFLLKNHRISYAYSATLRREMAEKDHAQPAAKPLLALAPFADPELLNDEEKRREKIEAFTQEAREAGYPVAGTREEMGRLVYSGEEVQVVSDLWGGDFLVGSEASLDRFVESAAQYRILHLSTHARADNRLGEHCFLAFAEDSLFVRDIYNLRLNADLVVLSACETGEGELLRGEGVISLARAFAYAGARSMVTSLWEVNDATTKEVMQRFHFYLHEGYDKDEALRVAKLQFMKQAPGVLRHPYFWAGFVVIGE